MLWHWHARCVIQLQFAGMRICEWHELPSNDSWGTLLQLLACRGMRLKAAAEVCTGRAFLATSGCPIWPQPNTKGLRRCWLRLGREGQKGGHR